MWDVFAAEKQRDSKRRRVEQYTGLALVPGGMLGAGAGPGAGAGANGWGGGSESDDSWHEGDSEGEAEGGAKGREARNVGAGAGARGGASEAAGQLTQQLAGMLGALPDTEEMAEMGKDLSQPRGGSRRRCNRLYSGPRGAPGGGAAEAQQAPHVDEPASPRRQRRRGAGHGAAQGK